MHYAIKQQHNAYHGEHSQGPNVEIVVQILHRLHKHQSRSRVDCIAVLEQCTHKEGKEQHEERHRATNESYRATRANVLIVHIIYYI